MSCNSVRPHPSSGIPLGLAATMSQAAAEQATREADLRAALATGAFRVHWQPIVACNSGELVGFEALLR